MDDVDADADPVGSRIARECAGNVHVSDRPFSPEAIARLLSRASGPARFNFVGLREPGVWALLCCPAGSALFESEQKVEITRIQCDADVQGTGRFLGFVEKLAVTCRAMDRRLVLGCVEGPRLLALVRRHGDVWHRLASDPTSYVYAPT